MGLNLGVFYHFPGSLPLFNPSDCPQSQRKFVALCGMMVMPRVEIPNCLPYFRNYTFLILEHLREQVRFSRDPGGNSDTTYM